jgi:hypothetical protein
MSALTPTTSSNASHLSDFRAEKEDGPRQHHLLARPVAFHEASAQPISDAISAPISRHAAPSPQLRRRVVVDQYTFYSRQVRSIDARNFSSLNPLGIEPKQFFGSKTSPSR